MTVPKALKFVGAFLVGFIVWFAVATVLNLLLRVTLSGYPEAERAMQFALPMLFGRLAVGAVSSLAAGFACAMSARSTPVAVKVLAAALVLFFIPVHYSLWAVFPAWYHATFLVSLAPLVLVGAWAASQGFRSSPM